MKRNVLFAILALVIGTICGVSVYLYSYFYPEKYIRTETGEYENVEVSNNRSTFPVTKDTQFEIEHFYVEDKRTLTEKVGNMPVLLGCDKVGVEKYLDEYMKRLSNEEREAGLSSYSLVSYNKNTICLRKTYKTPDYTGYYAKSFNGYIVILNGDERTVYEYTQIPVNLLPEDIQKKVQDGYFLENETDLYNFLEAYSS